MNRLRYSIQSTIKNCNTGLKFHIQRKCGCVDVYTGNNNFSIHHKTIRCDKHRGNS